MSEHPNPAGTATGPSADSDGAVVAFLKQRWLTIALVVVAAVFILQNRRTVAIRLLWLEVNSPMWLFLVLLFVAGFVAGIFVKRKRKNRSNSKG